MSSDVVLRVSDLSKVYRVYSRPHHRLLQAIDDRRGSGARHCFEVPAVRNVSFDLERGQAISIIGRNGSGKSTLLEMVAGALEPTAGVVEQQGRVSALLELGAGFNPDFSGRQNFRISAAIQGLRDHEIDAVEPLVEEFAEVGPFFDEPVRTYSSGMYVRVAFASAVHVQPDLLIVDEALAVGDIFFQQKCFNYIENKLTNAAKLIVTHDLASAVRLSHRCLVMDQGRVIFDGAPLEAVETYTALSLRERSSRLGSAPAVAARAESNDAAPVDVSESDDPDAGELLAGLDEVPPERSSDADAFAVLRAGVALVREGSTQLLDAEAPVVHPGDAVQLRFEVEIGVDVAEPIVGYLVRDRVGNALFGQNTIGSSLTLPPMQPGRYAMAMDVEWPEVEQGEYVVTLGLGDGSHPLHHDIVAWAQSVLRLTCVPSRPVHGFFNADVQALLVVPVQPSTQEAD
jgi:ABC-type polysaccharide/polyol phosphate transport system ATPase subunit